MYYALDTYRQTNEKIFNDVEFNSEETEPFLSEHSTNYDFRRLVKYKNNFRNPENRIVYITSSIFSFQNRATIASGLSDFHQKIVTVFFET